MLRSEGIPYDDETPRKPPKPGVHTEFVSSESHRIRHRHKAIDLLCSVDCNNRSKNDTIPEDVFSDLHNKVEHSSKDIGEMVNKFLAHSASDESLNNSNKNTKHLELKLDEIITSFRDLCQVSAFLSTEIFGESCGGFLATPQFDHLEHLATEVGFDTNEFHAHTVWDKFKDDCENWSNWNAKCYCKYRDQLRA